MCAVSVSEAFDKLKSLGPAATDVEMRSLGPDGGGSEEMLAHMIQLLLDQLKTGKDFELIQAHMSLFLKVRVPDNSTSSYNGPPKLRHITHLP